MEEEVEEEEAGEGEREEEEEEEGRRLPYLGSFLEQHQRII